jgi:hypothetical protein
MKWLSVRIILSELNRIILFTIAIASYGDVTISPQEILLTELLCDAAPSLDDSATHRRRSLR